MAATATWRDVLSAAFDERGAEWLTGLAMEELGRAQPLREDPDLRELAQASTAANLQLVLELARRDAPALPVEATPQAVAYARELARRNIPIAELARGYRVAQHLLWRFGVRALRARLSEDDAAAAIEAYTEATFATGDALIGSALDHYAAERDRWVRSADALRRATVQDLLDGECSDAGVASGRLRYELRREHVAFVVWEADEATALAVGGRGALVVPFGPGVIAGWCAPSALNADGARIAVGRPGSGIAGFRRSHVEAMEARRVARLGGLDGVVRYADVALVALLTKDLEQARAFAERTLGRLAEESRLAETVLCLLEAQGSPRHAAQRLGIHENTVAKRVRAAEEILGRPVTERPLELFAALLINRAVHAASKEP